MSSLRLGSRGSAAARSQRPVSDRWVELEDVVSSAFACDDPATEDAQGLQDVLTDNMQDMLEPFSCFPPRTASADSSIPEEERETVDKLSKKLDLDISTAHALLKEFDSLGNLGLQVFYAETTYMTERTRLLSTMLNLTKLAAEGKRPDSLPSRQLYEVEEYLRDLDDLDLNRDQEMAARGLGGSSSFSVDKQYILGCVRAKVQILIQGQWVQNMCKRIEALAKTSEEREAIFEARWGEIGLMATCLFFLGTAWSTLQEKPVSGDLKSIVKSLLQCLTTIGSEAKDSSDPNALHSKFVLCLALLAFLQSTESVLRLGVPGRKGEYSRGTETGPYQAADDIFKEVTRFVGGLPTNTKEQMGTDMLDFLLMLPSMHMMAEEGGGLINILRSSKHAAPLQFVISGTLHSVLFRAEHNHQEQYVERIMDFLCLLVANQNFDELSAPMKEIIEEEETGLYRTSIRQDERFFSSSSDALERDNHLQRENARRFIADFLRVISMCSRYHMTLGLRIQRSVLPRFCVIRDRFLSQVVPELFNTSLTYSESPVWLLAPFVEVMVSMANNKLGSRFVLEFFSRDRENFSLSWVSLLHVLQDLCSKIGEQAHNVLSTEQELIAIVDLIGCVASNVVLDPTELNGYFFKEGDFNTFLGILLQLLQEQLTHSLKAHILNALEGFAVHKEAAKCIMEKLDEFMGLPDLKSSFLKLPPAQEKSSGIRWELRVEEPMKNSCQTIAFLSLIQRIVERHGLKILSDFESRPAGFAPFLMMCVHDIFERLEGWQYDDLTQKWQLGASCVRLIVTLADGYAPHRSDFEAYVAALEADKSDHDGQSSAQPQSPPPSRKSNFEILDNTSAAPKWRPFQHPGFYLMVDSRDGSRFTKGLFKLLFSLSLVDSRVCSPEGKAMEDFAVEALQLLEFVLQWEDSFQELASEFGCSFATSRDIRLAKTIARSYPFAFNLATLVAYRFNPEIRLLATRIMYCLREFQSELVGNFLAGNDGAVIAAAFATQLSVDSLGESIIDVLDLGALSMRRILLAHKLSSDDFIAQYQIRNEELTLVDVTSRLSSYEDMQQEVQRNILLLLLETAHRGTERRSINLAQFLCGFSAHEDGSLYLPDGDLSQTILGFLEELLMAPCWESPEVYSLVMRVIHALLSDERTCQGMLEWFRRTTAQEERNFPDGFLAQQVAMMVFPQTLEDPLDSGDMMDADFHDIEALRSEDKVSCLQGYAHLLKSCAVTLFLSNDEHLVETLFAHGEDSQYLLSDQPLLRFLAFLDSIPGHLMELPQRPNLPLEYSQILDDSKKSSKSVDKDKKYDTSLLLLHCAEQLGSKEGDARDRCERDCAELRNFALRWNSAVECNRVIVELLSGWKELMEVLVEKHLADIPSDVRSDAVFSMLETLLTHIVNGDQDYVDGDEQLQLLRAQACVILMSCIRRNAQSAKGVIYEMTADHSNRILVLLLQSIWVSEKMEEVRGNIYAVLVQFERYASFLRSSTSFQEEYVSKFSRSRRQGSVEMMTTLHQKSIKQHAETFCKLVASDLQTGSTGSYHSWRIVAHVALIAVMNLAQDDAYYLIDALRSCNDLGHICRDLRGIDDTISFDAGKSASVYLLETRLVLLNRMAQSESGARALLDQSVVPLLCSCKFLDTVERKFCRHEDLQSRPSEEDLFLPTKALCAALRFVNSMLVTLPDHRQLQEEVTVFVRKLAPTFSKVLEIRDEAIRRGVSSTWDLLVDITSLVHLLSVSQEFLRSPFVGKLAQSMANLLQILVQKRNRQGRVSSSSWRALSDEGHFIVNLRILEVIKNIVSFFCQAKLENCPRLFPQSPDSDAALGLQLIHLLEHLPESLSRVDRQQDFVNSDLLYIFENCMTILWRELSLYGTTANTAEDSTLHSAVQTLESLQKMKSHLASGFSEFLLRRILLRMEDLRP